MADIDIQRLKKKLSELEHGLGEGSLDDRYFQIANNLSEGAAATIRGNLSLGSMATRNQGTGGDQHRTNSEMDGRYNIEGTGSAQTRNNTQLDGRYTRPNASETVTGFWTFGNSVFSILDFNRSGAATWRIGINSGGTFNIRENGPNNDPFRIDPGCPNNLLRLRATDGGRVNFGNQLEVGSHSTGGSSNGKLFFGSTAILNSSRSTTSGVAHYVFHNPNGQVGAAGTDGNNTFYGTSSDEDLKQDIEDADLQSACDIIKAGRPRTFAFRTTPTRRQLGFTAQEMAQVFPDAAILRNGELHGMIDYGKCTAVIWPALKWALLELEKQREEIGELQELVAELM